MSETMTAEQAASKLTNIMHDDHYSWHPSILTAFSMAVDALKGAEGDCISRADVNRVLEDWFRTVFGADSFRKTELCRELRELPSAQPEQPITCKDCKYYTIEFGWNGNEYTVCGYSLGCHLIRQKNDYCSRAERRTDDT